MPQKTRVGSPRTSAGNVSRLLDDNVSTRVSEWTRDVKVKGRVEASNSIEIEASMYDGTNESTRIARHGTLVI